MPNWKNGGPGETCETSIFQSGLNDARSKVEKSIDWITIFKINANIFSYDPDGVDIYITSEKLLKSGKTVNMYCALSF